MSDKIFTELNYLGGAIAGRGLKINPNPPRLVVFLDNYGYWERYLYSYNHKEGIIYSKTFYLV